MKILRNNKKNLKMEVKGIDLKKFDTILSIDGKEVKRKIESIRPLYYYEEHVGFNYRYKYRNDWDRIDWNWKDVSNKSTLIITRPQY